MRAVLRTALLAAYVLTLSACTWGPESPRGFRLPDGDAAVGKEVFVELRCHECHTVEGTELPAPEAEGPVMVALGGEVSRIKTYGDLVTSIINPSHKLAPSYSREAVSEDGHSLMKIYNEAMTVQQLVDLVAFLQPTYEVVPPQYEYVP